MELEAILEIKQLRYIAQDETRIGRKTETLRVITSRGVKPKVKVPRHQRHFGCMVLSNLSRAGSGKRSIVNSIKRTFSPFSMSCRYSWELP